MTGRHLYDKFTDAVAAKTWASSEQRTKYPAWPLLSSTDRAVWNDAARRLTPQRRKAATKA